MGKKLIGILIAALFTFCIAIFIGQPSTATSLNATENQMIILGIVDEVSTPKKLGLNYLGEQPVQLISSSELLDSIKRVSEGLDQLPEDVVLTFPAGTNSPIRMGELPNDSNNSRDQDYMYTGFLNNREESRDFAIKDVVDMTNTEYNNEGLISIYPDSQKILVADARNSFSQARRTPTIRVRLRNRKTGRRYLVRHININAVCRDLINAALTGKLLNASTGEVILIA